MQYSLICGLWILFLLLQRSKGEGVEIQNPLCKEKEKSLTLLSIAEDLVFNTKALCHKIQDTNDAMEESDCIRKKKPYSSNYVKLIKKLIQDIREDFPTCQSNTCSERPRDCSDVMAAGNTKSGVYTILPMSKYTGLKVVKVYCDMDTDGGGWTVIQRRGNFTPQEDFYRYWKDFKVGFGDVSRDFWLGNDNIYALSNQQPVEIRIELEDAGRNRRYAVYRKFRLEDEQEGYKLQISNYSGDAVDGMAGHDGKEFSTRDRGNTAAVRTLNGAWWINDWAYSHLNGRYIPGEDDPSSIHWFEWQENVGLAFTEMKVRPLEL